ncbi:hypothetical protein J3R30DRAFT_3402217 [Lentinula aciculospora]|uniref:Uncharacterized protein n=1 Tax=Lentinula aciculospora TaxID=153920 RepID=A0A9W9AKF4_9AGAR|nr:hypothetical protein J3R30DRAFT_3402217 [Lentinula aciculospora]
MYLTMERMAGMNAPLEQVLGHPIAAIDTAQKIVLSDGTIILNEEVGDSLDTVMGDTESSNDDLVDINKCLDLLLLPEADLNRMAQEKLTEQMGILIDSSKYDEITRTGEAIELEYINNVLRLHALNGRPKQPSTRMEVSLL